MDFRTRYQYNIKTDLIGRGGFAKVYKGYDTIRDCTVALKFFKSDFSEKYNLLNEIKFVINLEHPNICKYYDIAVLESMNSIVGEERTEVGILEYIDGGDIRTYLKQHPQHRDKLLKEVLHGLSYLHDNDIKKVIHRDIKPNNILIKNTTKGPVAKITDFGISKVVNSTTTTESSFLLGTIEFMAPEQFSPNKYGINGKLSTNLDLWSWGCLAYEIIIGESLFGSREKGEDREQLQNNIVREDYAQKLNLLPKPYRQAVKSCLIKDASKRVQKAEDIIAILEGTKKQAPDKETKKIEIKPPTPPPKKDKVITPLNGGNTGNDQGGKPKIGVYIKAGVIVLLIIGFILFAPIKEWLGIGVNGFTKTATGLEYKIFGGDGDSVIKYGSTVKLSGAVYYEDSLDSFDSFPVKIDSSVLEPYFVQILMKARKGDSIIIKIVGDSVYTIKGKYFIGRYKIWDIMSDSAIAAEQIINSDSTKISVNQTTKPLKEQKDEKIQQISKRKNLGNKKVRLRIEIKPQREGRNLEDMLDSIQ